MSTLETFEAPASLTTFFADLSDAELVAAVQAGRPESFAVLYRRHRAAVTRVCAARLRGTDLVQDAVQETFARALQALPAFTEGSGCGHWLKRIAKHVCIDLLRQGARLPVPYHPELQLADRQAETAFARCVDRQALEAVLGRLDRRDAAMLVAHHMAEEPLAATAERWSVTAGSAAVLLHRARKKARRGARPDGIGLVLAPFAPLRRLLRQVRERMPGSESAFAGLVNATTAQLVVAVALAVPTMASAGESTSPSDHQAPPAAGALLPDEAAVPPPAILAAPPAPAEPAPSAAAAFTGDVTAVGADPSASREPPVVLPPVEVEAADLRVHQEAPPDPDYNYGVDLPAAVPIDAAPGVMAHDEPEAEPVHQAACGVAELGEPLTYCHAAPQ